MPYSRRNRAGRCRDATASRRHPVGLSVRQAGLARRCASIRPSPRCSLHRHCNNAVTRRRAIAFTRQKSRRWRVRARFACSLPASTASSRDTFGRHRHRAGHHQAGDPFGAERSCDGHDADYSYRRNTRQRRGSEICDQSCARRRPVLGRSGRDCVEMRFRYGCRRRGLRRGLRQLAQSDGPSGIRRQIQVTVL